MRRENPVLIPPELQMLPVPPQGPEEDQDQLRLAERSRFVLNALLRRKWLAAATFLAVVAASFVVLKRLPKTYRVETRILAQRNEALPAAVRQGNAQEDAPTKSAWETVHSRESLLALIKAANLFTSEPAKPVKPSLRERIGLPPLGLFEPAPTEQDKLSALVDALNRSLIVSTTEGTVTISLEWYDAEQARRIVEAAVQNFLESRQLQEITTIDEMLSLLSGRAETLHEFLLAVEAEMRKEREQTASGEAAATQRSTVRTAPHKESEDTVQLLSLIESKRRAIHDVEDFRRRRLADLQAQLDEKRGIYSEAFPSVVSLKEDIEALSLESPQVATLREEVKKLSADLASRDQPGANVPGTSNVAPPAALPRTRALPPETDEQVERIHDARFRYERMVERINQLQLELDSARAGFKYRYAIVMPAETPRKAIRPKPAMVLGAGCFFAALLAVLITVLADLRTGLIYDPSQLRDLLDVPVLAEIRKP